MATRKSRSKAGAGSAKSAFKYRGRTKAQSEARANQTGGMYDSAIKDQFAMWKPEDGKNRIRILPPTWDDPDNYGVDMYVHYGVGTDNQAYLCSREMFETPCPICEERDRAERAGEDEDYIKDLKSTRRVAVWIINRDDESAGPLIWTMPWTIDKNIAQLSTDDEAGELLLVDHPEEGFDISFSKSGQQIQTKYDAIRIGRNSTPLSDDPDEMEQWLDFITEHPIPGCFNEFPYEHIAKVFGGGSEPEPEDDDDDPEFEDDEDDDPDPGDAINEEDDDDDEEEESAPARRNRARGRLKEMSGRKGRD